MNVTEALDASASWAAMPDPNEAARTLGRAVRSTLDALDLAAFGGATEIRIEIVRDLLGDDRPAPAVLARTAAAARAFRVERAAVELLETLDAGLSIGDALAHLSVAAGRA